MKAAIKYVAAVCLLIVLPGCATRIGSSHKQVGYDTKLQNIAIVYSQGNFGTDGMGKKLERYNFQNMGEYITKAAPRALSGYGVSASVYTRTATSEPPTPNEKQILFIVPARAETQGGRDGVVFSGPSLDPVKVRYELNLFDALLKKEVWRGDFYIVSGGLFYSSFDEDKAAAFLTDIMAKLESDGLVQKASGSK